LSRKEELAKAIVEMIQQEYVAFGPSLLADVTALLAPLKRANPSDPMPDWLDAPRR